MFTWVKRAYYSLEDSRRSHDRPRRRHRRSRPHPDRQGQGQWRAARRAARRPAGTQPARTGGAHRRGPGAGRRCHRRCRHPGRRPGGQHRPQCAAGRGIPRVGTRRHDRPAVRQQPAGHQLRRPGRAGRRLRPGHRRWRGVDGPRPDGHLGAAGQQSVRRGHGGALPGGPGATGHQRGTDRREVGLLAHPARRVLRRQSRQGRPRHQGRALRQRADPDRRARHRRDRPARHDGRNAGRVATVVLQRRGQERFPQINWSDHGGQLVAALRRQRRGPDHQQRARQQAGPAPAGADPHHDRRGLRPALHADRGHPGHREGAASRRADAGRHRPVRGERGVRARRARLGARHRGRFWPRPTSTAAPSRSVTRWAPAARAS